MSLPKFARIGPFLLAMSLGHGDAFGQSAFSSYRYINNDTNYGPVCYSVTASCRDSLDNIYVTGIAGSHPGSHSGACITEKFSPSGTLLWADRAATTESEFFPSFIKVDANRNVTVAGNQIHYSPLAGSYFVRHILASGTPSWTVQDHSFNSLNGLALDKAGNPIVMLTGQISYPVNGSLHKYQASNGQEIWNLPLDLPGTDSKQPTALLSDASGNVFALTRRSGYNSSYVDVARYVAESGAVIWHARVSDFTWTSVASNGDLLLSGLIDAGIGTCPFINRLRNSDGHDEFITTYGIGQNVYQKFLGGPSPDGLGKVFTQFHSQTIDSYGNSYIINQNQVLNSVGQIDSYTGSDIVGSPTAGLLAGVATGGAYALLDTLSGTYLSRLTSSGTYQWSLSPVPSFLNSKGFLLPDPTGVAYVNTSSDVNGNMSAGIARFDGNTHGKIFELHQNPKGTGDMGFTAVGIDAAGNMYVSGSDNLVPFIAKLAPSGALLWKTRMVSPDFVGAFIVGGYCNLKGIAILVMKGHRIGIAQLNGAGSIRWLIGFSLNSDETASKLVMDSNGNVDVASTLATTSQCAIHQFTYSGGTHAWRHVEPSLYPPDVLADDFGSLYCLQGDIGGGAFFKLNLAGGLVYSIKMPGCYAHCLARGPDSGSVYAFLATPAHVTSLKFSTNSSSYVSGDYLTLDTSTPSAISAKVNGGNFYVLEQRDAGTLVAKLMQGVKDPVWSLSVKNSTPTAVNFWDIDSYGNVLLASNSTPLNLITRTNLWKFDSATGTVRWALTGIAPFKTTFTKFGGLTACQDSRPLIVGTVPSLSGMGGFDGFSVKEASAPLAHNDSFTVKGNSTLNANVGANDEDLTGATCAVVSGPSHAASYSLSSSGQLLYKPAPNYTGAEILTYQWKGAGDLGNGNIATITIKVAP